MRNGPENAKIQLQTAQDGYGPLLERDYWTVIQRSRCTPAQVMELVAKNFANFAPAELCLFKRSDNQEAPLAVGDILNIDIRMAGRCQVKVLHRDELSFTLGTLEGHPEAGRITFGSYTNARGDVIFHIRSRAKSSNAPLYLGFIAVGEAMQTHTWTDFVNRVAVACGDGPLRHIHAEIREIADEDPSQIFQPTFVAQVVHG